MMSSIPMEGLGGSVPGVPDQIQAPKAGMFGGNGKMFLLAALSGLMARRNPQAAQMIQQAMMMKYRQKMEDQQYQHGRQDKRDDFMFEQNWKANHPAPVNNDTVADYNFRVQQLGKEAADEWLRYHEPPQIMNVPGVGLVQVPKMGGTGGAQPPQQAVDYLKANPNLKSDFDAKYGPGAADGILGNGGPGLGGPGGFPF